MRQFALYRESDTLIGCVLTTHIALCGQIIEIRVFEGAAIRAPQAHSHHALY